MEQTPRQPFRVAQVLGKMNNGGVEAVVMHYYRAIDRDKIQFDFFLDRTSAFPQRGEIERLGGRYYLMPPYYRVVSYVRALKRLFRENGYTIVHGEISAVNALPLLAARLAGVPVRICHNHTTSNWSEGAKTLLKYMLRPFARAFATDDFACGKAAGLWMFGRGRMQSGKVRIVPNAVEIEPLLFHESARLAERAALGAGENTFLVGHVGRFTFAKNHSFLLDVFHALHRLHPDSLLVLAGEGELLEEAERKVRALGLQDCVRFLGVRGDVGRLYSAMDALCLPSNYEGFPVVAVEAQVNGLPCVVSDRVTGEACMAENVTRLPIDDGPEAWAETLYAWKDRRVRPERSLLERFDIHGQARALEGVYLAMRERRA